MNASVWFSELKARGCTTSSLKMRPGAGAIHK
jgi:hypothetical protein